MVSTSKMLAQPERALVRVRDSSSSFSTTQGDSTKADEKIYLTEVTDLDGKAERSDLSPNNGLEEGQVGPLEDDGFKGKHDPFGSTDDAAVYKTMKWW
jgi:hypothetical protein